MSSSRRRPVVVAALVALLVAIAGGAASKVGPWYDSLSKPTGTPPDWVFAPVWTLIYATCVFAAVRGWVALRSNRDRAVLVSLFFANAVLNVLWSALFFTARRPDWALAEVLTLWLSVLAIVVFLWPRERVAAFVLAPYLVWVAYAGVINLGVVQLNGPFGGG